MALLEADVNFQGGKAVHQSCSGAGGGTGRNERTESGTDGDQDRK